MVFRRIAACPVAAFVLVHILTVPAKGQVTERASVSFRGLQASSDSSMPSLSGDGRFVAFDSAATNLVPHDTNDNYDVFVRDRTSGNTELISVTSLGEQANGESAYPSISADGRYVAFQSNAQNLVSGFGNLWPNVYLRDRQQRTTELVGFTQSGVPADHGSCESPSISADGRFVAFWSNAPNLLPGGFGGYTCIFVRDRQLQTTTCVSLNSGGGAPNENSRAPRISGDGRYVAFASTATNLVVGDTNGAQDVFLRDLQAGTTERISVDPAGLGGDGDSWDPAVSFDGRFVAFYSLATNLAAGDTNGAPDVFVRDRSTGSTERVSVSTDRQASGAGGEIWVSISGDGRFVTFTSLASLVQGDINLYDDAFVRDRLLGVTDLVDVSSWGEQAFGETRTPTLSPDGTCIAFQCEAHNLVPDEHYYGTPNIFVREPHGLPHFASLCDPGAAGVQPCPCQNPPQGPGQGCDNSAFTGGAVLSASGGTSISSDSLTFSSTGELPSATSLLLQGTAGVVGGSPYGQGVRCIGGRVTRLYTRDATNGACTIPDFTLHETPISVVSRRKGDRIFAGQSRWYLVCYRDTVALGGCPAMNLFNTTQTGRIDWAP